MSRRMGPQSMPKQYLALAGRRVIEWSLAPLLDHAACRRIIVVLSRDDVHWASLPVANHPKIAIAIGGDERADSVRAGLTAACVQANERDWILVHDAARPCLAAADLVRLFEQLQDDEVGGLLATPVVDTLKQVDESQRVVQTVPRERLWRALTPQLFRFGILMRAMTHCAKRQFAVTDEAQAIEALGLRPQVVAGDADNIKITLPEDLVRAARILDASGQDATPE
ncbi:2-C-methyl-D-erythritol 4-phosphate cytidylyltransferase [Steroidobacter denitrificans]|uniref:2-C-methyl-D-erythritol 4-phosphate cytidylyltransferase n=2 Tax=Steroidobacter denitrificans TaxID=465721 RepID=A0A127FA82_STEDE|nr:2-C-methyl-D-erythritol 4-phosphate cytidylyltransferase [Steroidobacter denitrificans]